MDAGAAVADCVTPHPAGESGSRWLARSRRTLRIAAAAVLLALLAAFAQPATAPDLVDVIVLRTAGSGDGADRAVATLGGQVRWLLPALDGFTASLPARALARLRASFGVRSATPDASLRLQGFDGFDPTTAAGSTWSVARTTGAVDAWAAGVTGAGVDVALVDSGVVEVRGLDSGRVVHGPDLSFEAAVPELRHLDTYGHGTHLAGVIAGRDPGPVDAAAKDRLLGVAPDARIVSVKVAEQHGYTDVSQVLAAIDWVIANKDRHGLRIRVLNLSFATDSTQGYVLDPLSYAVEQAWRQGIVVVVAAGNGGNDTSALPIPAQNPFVLAVGATDPRGTTSAADDVIASFSSSGSPWRAPDVVAPGVGIVSLRDPGSWLDGRYPAARIGARLFRGSGTSQAAAVVSGAVALLVQRRPGWTPDEVKAALTATARRLPGQPRTLQGAGSIDVGAAVRWRPPLLWLPTQVDVPATGLGSVDRSRGSLQLLDGGVPLVGDVDVMGTRLDTAVWASLAAVGLAFGDDGSWNANRWAGSGFVANRWAAGGWEGASWAANRWAGEEWTANRWAGDAWTGEGWTANRWSSNGDWSANRWSSQWE